MPAMTFQSIIDHFILDMSQAVEKREDGFYINPDNRLTWDDDEYALFQEASNELYREYGSHGSHYMPSLDNYEVHLLVSMMVRLADFIEDPFEENQAMTFQSIVRKTINPVYCLPAISSEKSVFDEDVDEITDPDDDSGIDGQTRTNTD
jgi:hypothetical protein